ncbi:MAG: hypothetical protein KDB66_05165 [Solirubrobacterales bacterium]|nr:hypothetical protein [Solirubrobacterales bacterium]
MERLRFPLLAMLLLAIPVALPGCGGNDPDPATVLDRALTRENLSAFGNGPEGPAGGVVKVQALGYEDRVLDEREVAARASVMSDIREALGADSGLRGLVDDLQYDGTEAVAGVATSHVSGDLDVAGLAKALDQAGGGDVGAIAGVDTGKNLEDSLVAADFDLYAGEEDGTIRRLDLTLALDDPDNALPPTRIRFSLTPNPSGGHPNQKTAE